MVHADEVFLDDLFDRCMETLRRGEEVDLDHELDGKMHLRARAQELLATAREMLGERAALARPELPGYEIVRELGRGAMGVVYLARQTALGDRLVAMKVLPGTSIDGGRSHSRFLSEARALARVEHPHVVQVFDVIEYRGLTAYAMEWVDGETLGQLIQRRNHSRSGASSAANSDRALIPTARYVPWVTRLGVDLARALAAVHAEGLLHRDVKPSNVLVREDGTAVLSDFGLVKDEEASLRTQTGAFLGTLAYAAPEQIRGEPVDVRADVYGLAATLYQALTSRLPVQGANSVQVLREIEGPGPVPLRKIDRQLPRDLETVLAKALDARRAARYESAEALALDLERILDLQPVEARPVGPLGRTWRLMRRNARLVTGVGVGFAVTLAAVLAWMAWGAHLANVRERAADFTRQARVTMLDTRPMLRDGAMIARIDPELGTDGFGVYLAPVGDLEGDGVQEFAVGACNCDQDGPDSGCVYVYSASGELRYTATGGVSEAHFGIAIAAVGDLDGDGIGELAVGTEPVSSRGAFVDVLSGADGHRLFRFGADAMDFGWRARANDAGDLDRDGTPDIGVGCFPDAERDDQHGRAFVFSGRTGELLLELRGDHAHAGFGENVVGVGDLDGDGRSEIAVSSWGTRHLSPPRVDVFDADGVRLASLPTVWRLLRTNPGAAAQPRFLAVRLGIWSRYARAPLGGWGTAAILEWAW